MRRDLALTAIAHERRLFARTESVLHAYAALDIARAAGIALPADSWITTCLAGAAQGLRRLDDKGEKQVADRAIVRALGLKTDGGRASMSRSAIARRDEDIRTRFSVLLDRPSIARVNEARAIAGLQPVDWPERAPMTREKIYDQLGREYGLSVESVRRIVRTK
jgi:hypothetical protein